MKFPLIKDVCNFTEIITLIVEKLRDDLALFPAGLNLVVTLCSLMVLELLFAVASIFFTRLGCCREKCFETCLKHLLSLEWLILKVRSLKGVFNHRNLILIRHLLCLECLKMDNSLLITVSFLFILVTFELFRFTLLIIPRVVLVEKGSIVIKSLGQRCILGSLRVLRELRIIVCMYIKLKVALLILSLCIKRLNIVVVMFIVPRI